MLSLVTPLPLFFAGLTQNWLWALFAGVVASAVMLAFGGGAPALIFLGATAGPVALLVRQALLARPEEGGMVWYPVDWLGWWLAGIGFAFGVATMFVMQTAQVDAMLDQIFRALFAETGLGESEMTALQEAFRRLVPAIFASTTIMLLVFNGALAQLVARRTGRAVRPALAMADLRLPVGAAVVLAVVSVASAAVSGVVAQLLLVAAAVLSTLFALAGLAVAHRLIGNRTGGGAALPVFYLAVVFMLIVLTPLLLLTLMLLGVADSFFDLRRRNSGGTGT